MSSRPDLAMVGGRLFSGLVDVTADVGSLDRSGLWVVVLPFDGEPVCARFSSADSADFAGYGASALLGSGGSSSGGKAVAPRVGAWESSLDRQAFVAGVASIRAAIAAGDVYQVNLCRRLSAPLKAPLDAFAFGALVAGRNPAPHSAVVSLPSVGLEVVSASPERFLRRDGELVSSRPIKGTAAAADGLSAKDHAENVMIVDLVRNDLGRVCEYGSISVPDLCTLEEHPGLVHLVSTVEGRLRPGVGWGDLLAATFPPGSVTGAPKLAALDMIRRLEPVARDVYCGAVGWVDADSGSGDLNVAIRTFWARDDHLHLGTGAGITWGSDAEREWEETGLKTARLLSLVEGRVAA